MEPNRSSVRGASLSVPLPAPKGKPEPCSGPGFPDGNSRCRGGGIRTHDLFVPNEARYQAAPHPA
jgi:hypothetical protein